MTSKIPAIWFPTIHTGTGTDVFTERLVEGLNQKGIKAEITWLPLRAEYAPWTVIPPKPPEWATVAHVNTWLHHRFLPKKFPVIATLHHSIHDPNLRPYKGWLRTIYHQYWIAPNERRVMQKAKQVTAVSHFAADIARKTLCNMPMHVIYNGIDLNKFKPSTKKENSNTSFRLLYVGSWMRRKGVDLLAPIMDELGQEFELYYTGDIIVKKNMPLNMHNLGRLNKEEVIQAMQNADALLFPSRSEGFGLVIVEAMACGLPVIASNSSIMPEIIQDNVTGFLCAQDDITMFVKIIRQLSRDKILQTNITQAAHRSVEQHFSDQKMVENYINIYFNLL